MGETDYKIGRLHLSKTLGQPTHNLYEDDGKHANVIAKFNADFTQMHVKGVTYMLVPISQQTLPEPYVTLKKKKSL